MAAKASVQIADILAGHDFSQYRRIVDVGGGTGVYAARQLNLRGLTSGL